MGRFFTALCIVTGFICMVIIALFLVPAIMPVAPFIVFFLLVWLVYKALKG